MDELVGGSTKEMRGGVVAEGDVSAAEVFQEWGVDESGIEGRASDLDSN